MRLLLRKASRTLVAVTATGGLLATLAPAPANAATGGDRFAAVGEAVAASGPSECQGTVSMHQVTDVKKKKHLEGHAWVECFGDVVEITSELWIQKYWKVGPDPGYWIRVGEISVKHFPGVNEKKFYNNNTVACSAVGGHGQYRAAAEASWENSEGAVGHTGTGYSLKGIYC